MYKICIWPLKPFEIKEEPLYIPTRHSTVVVIVHMLSYSCKQD